MTKGETRIAELLTQANITFICEKSFTDLRGGTFRYDFYLPVVNTLCEFDGTQHFRPVSKFQHTREEFLKTQGHDRRKNDYALAHDIPLYRIPYWELDNLHDVSDIFTEDHLVKTRYHNDNLRAPH